MRRILSILVVLALMALPAGVLANHTFGDVPDGAFYHEAATVMKEKGVTAGCNAAGTLYCPDDPVTRGQMAVFMDALGALSPDRTPVVNADRLDGRDFSQFWLLAGNAATTADHFIGTTDETPLEVKVNNQRALRIEPGTRPNLIGGDPANSVTDGAFGATIGGGGGDASDRGLSAAPEPNLVTDQFGTVGGGLGNQAGNDDGDPATGTTATVGGGVRNTASGFAASVGGGGFNTASGGGATLGGGSGNTASGSTATVGGGSRNTASGSAATVGGGGGNSASAIRATVGGGGANTAAGANATVPGGRNNSAAGAYSLAAGRGASVRSFHSGAFLWADSTDRAFLSAADNEVAMRASGGYRFFTRSDLSTGALLPANSGSWSSVSDRAAKEAFQAVDPQVVLAAVAEMPITTWRYKGQDSSVRHMGPTAQDFSAALGLGESERHISTVDADGVALAAIQGLQAEVEELKAEQAGWRQLNSGMWALSGALLVLAFRRRRGVTAH